jgi:hypothetical protein
MNGNNAQQPEVKITAVPEVYINVDLPQGRQVFQVDIARQLYTQLGLALASIDAESRPPAADKKKPRGKQK